ncbi:MAG TPA: glycosyltransferase, partial [Chloroflexia bacterium]|nr:glycosyltransferase [Chloroflexia bacterium]
PEDAWSLQNMVAEHGEEPVERFHAAYPGLTSTRYREQTLDLDSTLAGADLVMVHEWNSHDLVKNIGLHRARLGNYTLLFHDTHHRAATDPSTMSEYELGNYDGVLAFGNVIKELYLRKGWAKRAWTWHEAADTRLFRPLEGVERRGDLVWIGNWGDEERAAELNEFLIEPVKALGIEAAVFGVRYPQQALDALARAGIKYGGWLANFEVPAMFANYRVTVHVPRRPYTESLPGISTIRPFEAMACGIPLVSAPWDDVEGLFTSGEDFLVANNGEEMKHHLRTLLDDPGLANSLAQHGLHTILERHTCAHRVDELLSICSELGTREVTEVQAI